MNSLFMTPPASHFMYIPVVLLVGAIFGYVVGRKAGIKEAVSHYITGGDADDDELI